MIEAKEYLLQIPMWSKKKNTLSDLKVWIERLGILEGSMKIIHVAGTNGKGSVCAYLTSILVASDYQTGTFVSPHLMDIKERFLINGQVVDKELFQTGFERVYLLAEQMAALGYCHLTFFEYVLMIALWIFQELNVDIVILETGLGGRLDATNIFATPLLSIITSISLDHTQYLGDTVEQIAREKAGIIKAGVPVVFDGGNQQAAHILMDCARDKHVPFEIVTKDSYRIKSRKANTMMAEFLLADGLWLVAQVATIAEYQLGNAMLAIRALEKLNLPGVTKQTLQAGIEKTRWSGRMEEIRPDIFLDGAHNIGGIEAFIKTVKRKQQDSKMPVVLIFAVMNDKDYSKMIQMIGQQICLKHVSVVHIHDERGLSKSELIKLFQEAVTCPVNGFDHINDALQDALAHKTTDDLLFGTGSLYLIGEIQAALSKVPHP